MFVYRPASSCYISSSFSKHFKFLENIITVFLCNTLQFLLKGCIWKSKKVDMLIKLCINLFIVTLFFWYIIYLIWYSRAQTTAAEPTFSLFITKEWSFLRLYKAFLSSFVKILKGCFGISEFIQFFSKELS